MDNSNLSPVVLFTFFRPDHTRRTLEALAANELAKYSNLIIYSDAARNSAELDRVNAVRVLAHNALGFLSVKVIEREKNYGLAKNIIDGVTVVCNCYGRVIVLEDDMVTSPYFLTYMNEALDRYVNEDRVISIHGYMYPTQQKLPKAFFLRGSDCWGWATWQRGWDLFNSDGQFLLDELKRQRLTRLFDFNGAYPYTSMLKKQIKGQNDSWAVRWYASAFLADKLTLYPGFSLIHNIGHDNSGSHCSISNLYDVKLCETLINLDNISIEDSSEARQFIEKFFRQSSQGLLRSILNKVKRFSDQSGL
jgi:hypothetical protein